MRLSSHHTSVCKSSISLAPSPSLLPSRWCLNANPVSHPQPPENVFVASSLSINVSTFAKKPERAEDAGNTQDEDDLRPKTAFSVPGSQRVSSQCSRGNNSHHGGNKSFSSSESSISSPSFSNKFKSITFHQCLKLFIVHCCLTILNTFTLAVLGLACLASAQFTLT